MASQPTVLVTGSGGFLGAHIVVVLQKLGYTVISGKYKDVKEHDVLLDIVDVENTEQVFLKYQPQYVIHCAAYGVNYLDKDVEKVLSINLQGSINLLNAASRISLKRFIHVGSCFEYGSHDGPISEETLPCPTDIYGSSKAATTLLMQERANNLDVPLNVVRPFSMWGPGEKSHRLVPQIITAYINQKPLDLTSCNVIRDYTYVEDMAKQIVTLCFAENMEQGLVVNTGSGKQILLKDFVMKIARQLGCGELMNFGALNYRSTEMKSLIADISRLRSIIGEVKETPVEVGLERMLSMYKNNL